MKYTAIKLEEQKVKVLYRLVDKNNYKTLGYRIELNGKEYNIRKEIIGSMVAEHGIENAVLVKDKYIRGKGGSIEVIYINTKDRKSEFKDYSKYKVIDNAAIGGVTQKIIVESGDKTRYILKFAMKKMGVVENSHITEFVACKIAKKLGYKVQEVDLGYYEDKECVAIKMFGDIPTTFEGLGESTLEGKEMEYSLDWLLGIKVNKKFKLSQEQYIKWVWSVFVLDLFISNFDRHENNWGFIKDGGKYIPAPLFDLGASLYKKFVGEEVRNLTDRQIRYIIEFETRCAIIYKGKKRNYFEIVEGVKSNKLFRTYLNEVINRYKNIDLKGIYSKVSRFNSKYTEYIGFVDRMLNIKADMLESRCLK